MHKVWFAAAAVLMGCSVDDSGDVAADREPENASSLEDSSAPSVITTDDASATEDAGDATGPRAPGKAPLREHDAVGLPDARTPESRTGPLSPAGFGPAPVQNPWAAAQGVATQHGDTAASDTTPLAGPGANGVRMLRVDLFAACPTLLITTSGQLVAVCTQIVSRAPTVYLLDAVTGETHTMLELPAGKLFGGVYPYLDHEDRLWIVDGQSRLLRIRAAQADSGAWSLTVEQQLALAASDCTSCDGVVGLAPGHDGVIWFATEAGTIGVVDKTRTRIETLSLPAGEVVANSIATAPAGMAVVSDHALYLVKTDAAGKPTIQFRAAYDRGSARKPGQLSRGSGSTPTFFGPRTGSEYITITDNARPTMRLLVLRTDDGSEVCSLVLPEPAGLGSESSPIGVGHSVVVPSSYGYPYPALPEYAGTSDPPAAPLAGGIVRVDVADDAQSCAVVWSNRVRSAAVPKLSLADDLIYTIERKPLANDGTTGIIDGYGYSAIDAVTGSVAAAEDMPDLPDTMQLAGTIAPGKVWFQGTIFGFVRFSAE